MIPRPAHFSPDTERWVMSEKAQARTSFDCRVPKRSHGGGYKLHHTTLGSDADRGMNIQKSASVSCDAAGAPPSETLAPPAPPATTTTKNKKEKKEWKCHAAHQPAAKKDSNKRKGKHLRNPAPIKTALIAKGKSAATATATATATAKTQPPKVKRAVTTRASKAQEKAQEEARKVAKCEAKHESSTALARQMYNLFTQMTPFTSMVTIDPGVVNSVAWYRLWYNPDTKKFVEDTGSISSKTLSHRYDGPPVKLSKSLCRTLDEHHDLSSSDKAKALAKMEEEIAALEKEIAALEKEKELKMMPPSADSVHKVKQRTLRWKKVLLKVLRRPRRYTSWVPKHLRNPPSTTYSTLAGAKVRIDWENEHEQNLRRWYNGRDVADRRFWMFSRRKKKYMGIVNKLAPDSTVLVGIGSGFFGECSLLLLPLSLSLSFSISSLSLLPFTVQTPVPHPSCPSYARCVCCMHVCIYVCLISCDETGGNRRRGTKHPYLNAELRRVIRRHRVVIDVNEYYTSQRHPTHQSWVTHPVHGDTICNSCRAKSPRDSTSAQCMSVAKMSEIVFGFRPSFLCPSLDSRTGPTYFNAI